MSLFLKFETKRPTKPALKDYIPQLGTQDLATVEGVHYVVNLIRAALYTPRRTLFYARDVGTTLVKYLFEPLDELTLDNVLNSVTQEITSSLDMFDTTVNVRSLEVDQRTKSITVTADIKYGDKWYTITERIKVEEKVL